MTKMDMNAKTSKQFNDWQNKQLSDLKKKQKTVLLSSIAAIIIIAFAIFGPLKNDFTARDGFLIMGLLTGLVPFTLLEIKENKRKNSVDKNLPVFLLTLLSSVQSGSNLLSALNDSANRNLGALTPELKRLRANLSWGLPMSSAFTIFSKRIGTNLGKRVGVMLEIASDVGGDVTTTLELIQKHVTELRSIDEERRTSLSPYLMVIYVSFIIFLGVSVILVVYFFSAVESLQVDMEGNDDTHFKSGSFAQIMNLDITQIKILVFHMTLIESVFGGLAAGKLSHGSYVQGLKHAIIMSVITLVVFSAIGITHLIRF